MLERAGTGSFDYALHGGESTARIQWYFRERSTLPVAVHVWELEPGASEGMHAHDHERPLAELYLVIEGEATMHVGAEVVTLGPGDAVLAPVDTEHDLANTGDTTLKVVVIWGPPGTADWSGYGTARAASEAAKNSQLD